MFLFMKKVTSSKTNYCILTDHLSQNYFVNFRAILFYMQLSGIVIHVYMYGLSSTRVSTSDRETSNDFCVFFRACIAGTHNSSEPLRNRSKWFIRINRKCFSVLSRVSLALFIITTEYIMLNYQLLMVVFTLIHLMNWMHNQSRHRLIDQFK